MQCCHLHVLWCFVIRFSGSTCNPKMNLTRRRGGSKTNSLYKVNLEQAQTAITLTITFSKTKFICLLICSSIDTTNKLVIGSQLTSLKEICETTSAMEDFYTVTKTRMLALVENYAKKNYSRNRTLRA